ncbi:MAG TPA: HDOD domain-containing protein [Burkholderiaceae bacterium]|nr:HDOD domain-containing protein [Burkholderiaceae bacterium]
MIARALPNPPAHSTAPAASPHPTRAFGRFELRRLLGKSAAAMVWLAYDPAGRRELMLTLPRVQPATPAALEAWLRDARAAARLDHPNLAKAAEIGVQDHWPFVAVDRSLGVTMAEWLAGRHGHPAPADTVACIVDALQGLAFAHDAGVAHHDLQPHSLIVDERGAVRVMAFGVVPDAAQAVAAADAPQRAYERAMALAPSELRARRVAAARDVLAIGLLLHGLLAGEPALEQPDLALVIARIAPLGRELVRLPWALPLPVPEALRAIVNRCTSGQERLRYQNARTLLGALAGWLESQAEDGGGPVALLLDRLRTVGHLPALPGLAARVARVTSRESQRTDQIADQVLADTALCFELLRTLNSAQVQGTQVQGNGPVLTLRRIISLIGVNGVHLAANALRPWPGPLSDAQAQALQRTLDRVRLAGHTAQALRPKGYDAQVVYLIAVLQNLGRLMLRYHFADEAEQIAQLTRPIASGNGQSEQPGLSEEAAAYAVLGVDIESLGAAVARHWGLADDVLHMVRRLPPDAAVRKPDSDAEVLRITASAANEAVDAIHDHAAARVPPAIAQVAQRYGRALGVTVRDVQEALQAGRERLQQSNAPYLGEQDEAAASHERHPEAADTQPG